MDIVYSSSDSYCEIAGISILSLLEHNRNVKELNLYRPSAGKRYNTVSNASNP